MRGLGGEGCFMMFIYSSVVGYFCEIYILSSFLDRITKKN